MPGRVTRSSIRPGTSLTSLSVDCADRIVATVSSSGLRWLSSQCASGWASARRRAIRRALRLRPKGVSAASFRAAFTAIGAATTRAGTFDEPAFTATRRAYVGLRTTTRMGAGSARADRPAGADLRPGARQVGLAQRPDKRPRLVGLVHRQCSGGDDAGRHQLPGHPGAVLAQGRLQNPADPQDAAV